jgi:hypothetical protein
MHTTEQARALWCPQARVARHEFVNNPTQDYIIGGTNSDALGSTRVPASCCCIATECSMWRWVNWQEPAQRYAENRNATHPGEAGPTKGGPDWVFAPASDEEYARWIEPAEKADARRRGYCGLAGRPGK